MYRTEHLSFDHQEILEKKFKQLQLNISEYTFANLYLFRKLHGYEVIFAEEIFIKGKMREGLYFLMPTSHPATWSISTFDFLQAQALCLYPIPFEWLTYLINRLKVFNFNEADSDYLFNTSKIAHYPGRGLIKKRSLVKHLFESHQVRSMNFQIQQKQEALEIIEMWQEEIPLDKKQNDYESAIEMIDLFEQLNLTGRIYYVDSIPKGILIGESLNANCFTLHFGKASRKLQGLNQFMFQDFAQVVEKQYRLLNFEQDLGLENLRQTKHSYHPDQLLQKYRVYLVK